MAEQERIISRFITKIYPKDDPHAEWSICKYEAEDGRQFFASGNNLPCQRGSKTCLIGAWTVDRKTGRKRFEVDYVDDPPISKKAEVVAYLIALHCKLGQGRAENVYKTFGEKSWDIIENNPERLKEVRGIGPAIYENLLQAIAARKTTRRILGLLARAQVTISGNTLTKLELAFGDTVVDTLTQNPYCAYAVQGFTWEKCEALALALKIPQDSPYRLQGLVSKILTEASISGHVCLPKLVLLESLVRESGCGTDACKQAINEVWQQGVIKSAGGMLALANSFDIEASVAQHLHLLMTACTEPVGGLDALIKDYESHNQIQLADMQKEAIRQVFLHPVSIITGGPGVGKTTVTKAILTIHREIYGMDSNPVLLAPTGKAARRMSEATGFPAATIHSAVGWRGDDRDICLEGPIPGNLVLVDEASMMDQKIASILLEHIDAGTRIVFIGDIDQLPSVGAGYVLHDMIESGVIPTTRLNVIYRQSETSPIITNAHKINAGESNLVEAKSFQWIETSSEGETFLKACKLYTRCVKAYGVDNVVLLNPQRNGTALSVENFNLQLQMLLNPPRDGEYEIKIGKTIFRAGDRVMELKNGENAKNGDVGIIREIARRPDEDDPDAWVYFANIEFNGDGVCLEYLRTDLEHVTHAWCTTVHKSQGSQYRTVLQVVSKAHPSMLKRNLVYTGITRAQENVALIGERDALSIAVGNNATEQRYTLLEQRLKSLLSKNNH